MSVKRFERILVAVDDSDDSEKAFEYAVMYAKQANGILGIATVMEINRLNVYQVLDVDVLTAEREKAARIAETYRQRAEMNGLTGVEVLLDEGEPGPVIVDDILPRFKGDFLVCGSKSNEKKGLFTIGSQAAYMAKNAPCSVMVVR